MYQRQSQQKKLVLSCFISLNPCFCPSCRKMNPNEEGNGVWWLNLFLARTFFLACNAHTSFGNHQNKYCIDCEMAACQHCMAKGTHADHRVITIYRLVYNDVVSLDQMSKYIDCSRIQPYASNGKQVIALHPLPHYNSGQINLDRACRTCTRILMNPNIYSYCSVACKPSVKPATADQGDAGAGNGAGAGAGSGAGARAGIRSGSGSGARAGARTGAGARAGARAGAGAESGARAGAGAGTRSKGSESRARKRKGIPHRAPLF